MKIFCFLKDILGVCLLFSKISNLKIDKWDKNYYYYDYFLEMIGTKIVNLNNDVN